MSNLTDVQMAMRFLRKNGIFFIMAFMTLALVLGSSTLATPFYTVGGESYTLLGSGSNDINEHKCLGSDKQDSLTGSKYKEVNEVNCGLTTSSQLIAVILDLFVFFLVFSYIITWSVGKSNGNSSLANRMFNCGNVGLIIRSLFVIAVPLALLCQSISTFVSIYGQTDGCESSNTKVSSHEQWSHGYYTSIFAFIFNFLAFVFLIIMYSFYITIEIFIMIQYFYGISRRKKYR